jgi:hypothetical protein
VRGQFKIGRYIVSRMGSAAPEGRMTLFPHSDDQGPVDEALLFFRGSFAGDVVSHAGQTAVRAILPPTEFEHWYKIVQTEDPVFLRWEEQSDKTLLTISLSTGKEPPGEGFG